VKYVVGHLKRKVTGKCKTRKMQEGILKPFYFEMIHIYRRIAKYTQSILLLPNHQEINIGTILLTNYSRIQVSPWGEDEYDQSRFYTYMKMS
jgi:hypothetical protein